ncbi:MAG: polysaccharide pyruvyl transferase family protein [Acidaminococcaceae bacterium]|nr:polysaccharide pyruvyl transferase family protein [Acidaminococcaceae bacterium]
MKVGILSMQRVVNYGSFLQAYALKETLISLGHEVYFIDIKPNIKITYSTPTNMKDMIAFFVKRLDRNIIKRVKHFFFYEKRNVLFHNEFFPVLGLSNELSYRSNYDAVVIGSDEVFNCIQKSPWGFAKTLFGEGLDTNNIITYAASCGHTTLEGLEQYGIREEVQNAMGNLKTISVRDANTKKFAEDMTGKVIYEHLDPTLIYDFGDLVPDSVPEKNYILVYAYDGRINEKDTIGIIKDFAKKERKKVISVGVYQSWCDKNILCTPFELLGYFKYADYIVTDTFHGTVFSIKYNKQFVTIIRESNKEKLTDLLKRLNLKDRIVETPIDIIKKAQEIINYQSTNEIIIINVQNTIKYLNKYLQVEESGEMG